MSKNSWKGGWDFKMKLCSVWGKHNLDWRLTEANKQDFSRFPETSTNSYSLGFNIWNMPECFQNPVPKHEEEYYIFLFLLIPLIVVHVYWALLARLILPSLTSQLWLISANFTLLLTYYLHNVQGKIELRVWKVF